MHAYADGITIIAQNRSAVKDVLTIFESEVEKMGLIVNKGKTKYTKIYAVQSRRLPLDLLIVVYKLEGIKNISYLREEMNCENDMKRIRD